LKRGKGPLGGNQIEGGEGGKQFLRGYKMSFTGYAEGGVSRGDKDEDWGRKEGG